MHAHKMAPCACACPKNKRGRILLLFCFIVDTHFGRAREALEVRRAVTQKPSVSEDDPRARPPRSARKEHQGVGSD